MVLSDAEPTLRALQRTHRLGLVTNGPADLQRAKLRASGLGAYFEAVVVPAEISETAQNRGRLAVAGAVDAQKLVHVHVGASPDR